MCIELIDQNNAEVTALLDKAANEPVILRTERSGEFALLPLDEEVIDLLLERNPQLIAECRAIGERMASGQYVTQAQMLSRVRE